MLHNKEQELQETILRISGVNPRLCMKCGKCSGTCPAYDEMDIRPHQFVNFVEKGQISKLLESKSIWNCLSCFACIERCPRTVEPAKLVEAVRLMVIREQGKNHLKPEQIPELLDENLPQQAIASAFRKYSK
ncbi:MAG: 4Fe-4S dicluster domain-containing protein [Eubacteriales bacterium]